MERKVSALAWARSLLGSGVDLDREWGPHRGESGGEVWRLRGEGPEVFALKLHGPGRSHGQAHRANESWGTGRVGLSIPVRAWNHELRAMLAPWGAAKSRGSFDYSDFRAVGVLLGRLHALNVAEADELSLPAAFERRMDGLLRGLGDALERDLLHAIEAMRSAWAESWAGRRVPCHRDPRPENLLSWEGQLRLIDFEHAREDAWAIDLAAARSSFGAKPFEAIWSGYRNAGGGQAGDRAGDAFALQGAGVLRALQTLSWEEGRGQRTLSARADLRRLCSHLGHMSFEG